MNTEIKKKWVTALRSGKYPQGSRGQLRKDILTDGVDVSHFCCLGVLCDLAVEEGIISDPEFHEVDGTGYEYVYGDEADSSWSYLPRSVFTWAGLPSSNPRVTVQGEKNYSLSALNDGNLDTGKRYTFDQIADLIEEQL